MSILQPNRRGFIAGLASLITAPAIVRVGSIMPVKSLIWDGQIGRVVRIRLPNDYTVTDGPGISIFEITENMREHIYAPGFPRVKNV